MSRKGSLLLISLVVAISALSQQRTYQEADSIRLSEVIVNAYQLNTRHHQLPGSISLLTGEEMERGDGNNFASILHAMPGIYMHSGTYATSRIVIRGVGSRTPYNTNRIRAYLNDIPITSSDGISTPEDIDLTGIARMELIKGPASALYGSGLGGNINLYTPQAGGESGSALLQYGSFNTMKAAAGANMQRYNLQIGGQMSHLRSDGHRENNRLRRTTLLSSGSWRQPSWSLSYTLLLIDMNAQIPSSIGKSLYEGSPESAAATSRRSSPPAWASTMPPHHGWPSSPRQATVSQCPPQKRRCSRRVRSTVTFNPNRGCSMKQEYASISLRGSHDWRPHSTGSICATCWSPNASRRISSPASTPAGHATAGWS
ncbi:MAG: TonB-dependent receptor [bacterium]|nr:TonB-dependent receptor [bacterium]